MKKCIFFANFLVIKNNNKYYFRNKEDCARFSLLTTPFAQVNLVCQHELSQPDEMCVSMDSSRILVTSTSKSDFDHASMLGRFLLILQIVGCGVKGSQGCDTMAVFASGPPIFHAGLLLSIVCFRKPMFAVFVGSVSASYRIFGPVSARRRAVLALKYAGARLIERFTITRASLVLGAGNVCSRLSVPVTKSASFSTALSSQWPSVVKSTTPLSRIRVSNRNSLNLIYVGRLSYEKGMDVLLSCFFKVKQKVPIARLKIVGELVDDPSSLVKELQLEKDVEFIGKRSQVEIVGLLANSDIFVFFSRHEGMPRAPLEAMYLGLPVVCSRTGADVYVDDGVNGFVVDDGDFAAAAEHIIDLYGNEFLMQTFSLAALRRSEVVFAANNDVLTELLSRWVGTQGK